MEALGSRRPPDPPRSRRTSSDAYAAERYTLRLRTFFFPTMELAYAIPVTLSLVWGGWLVSNGHATLGQVTAVTLYAVQLVDPVDRLVSWLDEVQVGATALSRILGVELVPPDRVAGRRGPGRRARPRSTTSGSPTGRTATSCTASTWTSARASGWPSSARPAPASRPSAGCWPASTRRGPAR